MALNNNILAYWKLDNDGSGNISLLDATGYGNSLSNQNGAIETTGKINGGAGFGNGNQNNLITDSGQRFPTENTWGSISCWFNATSLSNGVIFGDYYRNTLFLGIYNGIVRAGLGDGGGGQTKITASISTNQWYNAVVTYDGTTFSFYLNGSKIGDVAVDWSGNSYQAGGFSLGSTADNFGGDYQFNGTIDEVGVWATALTQSDVTELYNSGSGVTYPFNSTPQEAFLYYNNSQEDGDWGNVLNWWKDINFTIQSTIIPTSTNQVFLYNEVTQNTQDDGNCFCSGANFWSANFGAGLTLQTTGVVNMQGSSILAGTTTDGVSMHDSSQIAYTGVVGADVVMRNSSRNYGTIDGNATVYYDNGNWQNPIGGTVLGTVTYIRNYILYYTNASSDGTWETLTNWNTASDGSGDTPTEIPWTNTDGSTSASNLYDATGGAGIYINSADIENWVTGVCSIDNIFYQGGNISGGTWSGAGFTNDNGINGGTFTGDNFFNEAVVFGGTFSNNGFNNKYTFGYALFTGSNFDNSYGYVYNSDIRGSFNNFPVGFNPDDANTWGNIVTQYSPVGWVFDTYFSGPSTGTTAGPLGPYYVYADSIGAIKYPTPTGGGGGGIDISRLLGLPFFIKI